MLKTPDIELGRRGEGRITLSQVSTLLGVLGLMILFGVAGYMAWNERQVLFREGRERAEQEAHFLAEHARRLFEVADVALRATETAAGGKDWATIEQAPAVRAGMREFSEMLPYVDVVFLADETGRVRQTTLDNPPADYSVADRPIFKDAAATPGDALLIGGSIIGKASGRPTFLVARRLSGPDGQFRGIVAGSMSLDYFTQFWARLDTRNDERILLVRGGSGNVLVRFPEARSPDSNRLIGDGVLAAALGQPEGGLIAPSRDDSGSYHRIGDLSAYVAVVYRNTAITRQWLNRMATVLPFFAVVATGMLFILLVGRRLARRETAARQSMDDARALLAASNARLEQRVAERTAALQEINEEVQRFAYIVSHDLRAPLVNIMGFTTELSELRGQLFAPEGARRGPAAEPDVRAEFDEALGFIQSSIDKMDRLIKAILALSRQGQRQLRPEALDMDALMRSIADGVAHRVMQGGTRITIDPLPPLVADRVAVEQIFSNLIDNAVKYLRPDVPGVIRVSGTASAGTVSYVVRDNGRGIEPKDRERVFELFRRAGRQDQPGEGIGLAYVRSLVRRLEGSIELDSQPGLGCAFTVTLPKSGTDGETR